MADSTLFDGDAFNPESLFDYDQASISPTNAFFPTDLFNFDQDNQRLSISSSSDAQQYQPYLSRPPSLSPASQSAQLLHPPHSPHSSASPHSVFSASTTDDLLLNNSFSSADLDQLLLQPDAQMPETQAKPGQPFFFPQTDLNEAMLQLLGSTLIQPQQTYQFDQQQPPLQASIPAFQNAYTQPMTNTWQDVPPSNTFDIGTAPEATPIPAARKTKPMPAARPAPRRAKSDSPPEEKVVGKHNKTERRYRQKVQLAQADLRDSVPALRVLYKTSTEEQKQTTDFRAPDGTVDGLGEFNRPNASAKTTIFVGARMYIELLQARVASLQRRADELETFRTAVAGEENTRQWREDFEAREAIIKATMVANKEDSYDEDEESEEEEPKRKKAKATKGKKNDIQAFAAFAFMFSFLPSASTVLSTSTEEAVHHYTHQPASTGQVLQRLPLITAEHTSRLLARVLPPIICPSGNTVFDWTWRFLFAYIAYLLLTPLLRRLQRTERYPVPAGDLSLLAKDAARAVFRKGTISETDKAAWTRFGAHVVGGATSITPLARYHLALRLNRSAVDAQSLALLALLSPTLPLLRSPMDIWAAAKAAITADTPSPLRQVLALGLDEARRALHLLPPTTSPLTALAEQITLVHLNDLYSRFFVQLVDAATKDGQIIPDSVKTLLGNVDSRSLGKDLRASLFDKEIRGVVAGVPRGTAAHALGLVLIGLWGLLTGPSPNAQAALASALAAEEVKGVGSSLASVGALRELLYPGSSMMDPAIASLPSNAVTLDKLALVCISFIRLLATVSPLDVSATRLERLAESRKVQKASSDIRLVLTQTTFAGMEEELEAKSFDVARERLVTVLSIVGRRAAGRATGRDEDSGLEGDVEEL